MSTPTPASPRGIHYAWIVAAVTFVVLLITAGVRATPGLFMVPLESEFGWSRAAISAAIAVNIALFGLIGPFAASVMDRWGLRRVVLGALALLAASVAVSTRMQTEWQFLLLWGVLVGSRHRRHGDGARRGRRHPLVRRAARRGDGHRCRPPTPPASWSSCRCWPVWSRASSWRSAALIVAAAAGDRLRRSCCCSCAIGRADLGLRAVRPAPLMQHRPLGDQADGAAGGAGPCRRARRAFWILAGTFFICGASTNGLIGTHLISACHDVGIPAMRSAQLLALMGIFDILGTMASGWLTDRYSARHLLLATTRCVACRCCSCRRRCSRAAPRLGVFAVFYGLDWIATVPPTVKLTTEAFGRENTGVIYGWIGASHQLGASMAAFGAGAIRTELGDYRLAFLIAGVLCLIAGASFLTVGAERSALTAAPAPSAA